MRITGATVLLTGVTGGIGGALAAELSAKGAKLVLTGRRREALEPLADRYGARTILADLADADDVRRLADEAAGTDILIANAALPSSGDLLDYTPEQIDRALAVNLRAPAMLARLLAPAMVEAGRGHLAFVGSISGKAATKSSSLYNATKFGAARLRARAAPGSARHGCRRLDRPARFRTGPGDVRGDRLGGLPRGVRTVSPRQVVAVWCAPSSAMSPKSMSRPWS